MKLAKLKEKFKNKYAIRIIAGVLVVTLIGTGVSVYDVSAAKPAENTKTVTEQEDVEVEDAEEALDEMLSSKVTINEKEIGKEETVYVIADNTGVAQNIIVSDHLLNNDNKKTIEDVSSLTDITNVKGDETFTQEGKRVVWQADGNDIYYQGTTEGETPVTQKITYYLDGKEIEPEELAGKSGKVTIRFDYTNHEKVGDVYVPFMAISGMILDDSFSNVEVTNGKVIADGNRDMVIGYALPGLKDSLDVSDKDFDGDITIPEYFEMTADVEDFSLDMTMTVVMNAANFIGAEGTDGSLSLADELDTLTDATKQLQDGSAELAEGVDTLQEKLGEFQTGMNTLADGVSSLKSGAGTLADGAATLNSSAKSISDGIATLDNTLRTPLTDAEKAAYSAQAVASVDASFAAGGDTYNYIYNSAKQSFTDAMSQSTSTIADSLATDANGNPTSLYQALFAVVSEQAFVQYAQTNSIDIVTISAADYQNSLNSFRTSQQAAIHEQVMASINTLASSVTSGIAAQGADSTAASVVGACQSASEQAAASALVTGIETTKSSIADSIEAKQANGYSLVTGAAALSQGTQSLADKVPELVKGVNELNEGAGKLKNGTGAIVEGVGTLDEGAHELADGIVTFNEEGIEKIVNAYNGDLEPLMDRLQAVIDAGEEYQSYTGVADGVNGSVKFIFKTDAVKAE